MIGKFLRWLFYAERAAREPKKAADKKPRPYRIYDALRHFERNFGPLSIDEISTSIWGETTRLRIDGVWIGTFDTCGDDDCRLVLTETGKALGDDLFFLLREVTAAHDAVKKEQAVRDIETARRAISGVREKTKGGADAA